MNTFVRKGPSADPIYEAVPVYQARNRFNPDFYPV